MRIQHNIMAMNAYRNYTSNVSAMKSNLEKLSSGYKINRAGDDAAGLAISEKMRAQITGLQTAQKNAKSGINLVQTAEGALTEVHDMLNRMVELATQSANGTYDVSTDRAQMQKEVNQLLEEIDRIADSANFNGIKLLDGTLGLNQDAFKIETGADYKAAVDPKTTNFELASTGSLAFHYGDSVTAQAPSFKIDMDNLTFTNDSASASIASTVVYAKVTFAGKTLELKHTGGIASGASLSATDIAADIASAFNTLKLGADSSKVGSIAGGGFSASAANGVVTFTYEGAATATGVGTAAQDTAGNKLTDKLVSDINAKLGGAVSFTVGTAAAVKDVGKLNGDKQYVCDITAPQNAVAKKDGTRPGAGIDIGSYVKNGYKLTIDNNTYVFKTGTAAVTTKTGETLIDVSKWAPAKQAEMAAMMIAGGAGTTTNVGNAAGSSITTDDFKISYGGGSKLHIDVKASKVTATTGYKGDKADVQEKIESKLSWTDAGKAAVAASTKLTVTASAIKEGNTVSITDGSKTTKYVFTDDAAKLKLTGNDLPANTKYVEIAKNKAGTAIDASKTVENLADKINEGLAKGKEVAEVATNGKTITISAAKAAASVGAPLVLGKGLTLQIGDTSDDFNQLNVKVQDMHSGSLGIGKLDISTEEAAQAAVDKIKAAINTVSDVRGTLGATQNRLDHTINNLSVMTENIQDAESTIRDTDVAEEMMAYTKNNILIQSAQAMLAQANQVPQGVLQLLG